MTRGYNMPLARRIRLMSLNWEKDYRDQEHRRQIGMVVVVIIIIFFLANYNPGHDFSQDQASGYSSPEE